MNLNTRALLGFLIIATTHPTPGAVLTPSSRCLSSETAFSLTLLSDSSGEADPHPADSRRGLSTHSGPERGISP